MTNVLPIVTFAVSIRTNLGHTSIGDFIAKQIWRPVAVVATSGLRLVSVELFGVHVG